jgi:hypothetical protein
MDGRHRAGHDDQENGARLDAKQGMPRGILMKFLVLMTVSALALCGAANADVSISNKPTQNMSCDAGVCTATAQKAVLNVSDLQTMLASGDATVKTGTAAEDINIDKPLTWSSRGRLTLDAQHSVVVKRAVSVTGTGAMTITPNDEGGKRGAFIIVQRHGRVEFWDLGSSLTIDGNSYTLAGDIKTLAADIEANPKGFYALAKPYDASADGPYRSSPVSVSFNGTFEGLGNAITNLAIDLTHPDKHGYAGLFSEVDSRGSIRDLSLLRVRIDLDSFACSDVGAVAAINFGVLLQVHATGKIAGLQGGCYSIGGLVGETVH